MKLNKKEYEVECLHYGENKRLTDDDIINKIKFKKGEEDPALDHIEEIHYFMNKITSVVNNNANFLNNFFKKFNSKTYLEENKFHNYLKNVNNSLAYDENQNESYLLSTYNKSYNERLLEDSIEDSIKSNMKFMNIISSLEKENKLNFFEVSKKVDGNLMKIEEIEKIKVNKNVFDNKFKEFHQHSNELNLKTKEIINEKNNLLTNDLNNITNNLYEKLGNLEKDCLWKIKDFEELLKTRVNEIFVNNGMENLETKLLKELKELQNSFKDIDIDNINKTDNVQNQLNFDLLDDKIKNIKESILKVNSKIDNFCTRDDFESYKSQFTSSIQKMEMNFKDNFSITKTFIDKYEDIHKRLNSLYDSQKNFKKFENQISSKFNLLLSEVNNIKIINEKYSLMKNYEKIVNNVSNNEKIDKDIIFNQPKSSGNGLNINEIEDLKEKIINEIEESFDRRLNNYDDLFSKFKLSWESQNDTILRLQNEIFYKISKEEFENIMQLKLGKEEFYEINNKNIKELEKIELVTILSNQTSKKVVEIKNSLEKKIKEIISKFESIYKDKENYSKFFKDYDLKINSNTTIIKDNSAKLMSGFKDILNLINDLKNEFELSQSDKKRTLATTKPLICLSCGENEPKWIPPTNYIKGNDGQYYQTDINFIGKKKDKNQYLTGQDIITREEIIKGHTIHHHLPVENLKPGTDIFGQIIIKSIKKEPRNVKKTRPISEMKKKTIKNRLIYK